MDILGLMMGFVKKTQAISDGLKKDAFKSKHRNRMRFYELLIGYINSPDSSSPANFFDWYTERLDERMKTTPQWLSLWYKLTKSKSEGGFRAFLTDCSIRSNTESKFVEILKPWIPSDEYRIIASSPTADITESLRTAIDISKEKEGTQKQVHGAFFSNIPIIGIGFFFHWVIYSFVYQSFITPGFENHKLWEDMTMLEQNFIRYEWIIANYLYLIVGLVAIVYGLSWSIKNWSSRFVFLREHYIDYIPPYSLSKLNEQYNILMILSSFMKSGASFPDSLDKVKEGGSPYVQYQVDKILNTPKQAHIAINTLFLGDYGSDIRDRGNHISLELAITDLLPGIQESKREKFDRIVSITSMLSFKPVIYGSLGFAIVPLFISIFDSLPKT